MQQRDSFSMASMHAQSHAAFCSTPAGQHMLNSGSATQACHCQAPSMLLRSSAGEWAAGQEREGARAVRGRCNKHSVSSSPRLGWPGAALLGPSCLCCLGSCHAVCCLSVITNYLCKQLRGLFVQAFTCACLTIVQCMTLNLTPLLAPAPPVGPVW